MSARGWPASRRTARRAPRRTSTAARPVLGVPGERVQPCSRPGVAGIRRERAARRSPPPRRGRSSCSRWTSPSWRRSSARVASSVGALGRALEQVRQLPPSVRRAQERRQRQRGVVGLAELALDLRATPRWPPPAGRAPRRGASRPARGRPCGARRSAQSAPAARAPAQGAPCCPAGRAAPPGRRAPRASRSSAATHRSHSAIARSFCAEPRGQVRGAPERLPPRGRRPSRPPRCARPRRGAPRRAPPPRAAAPACARRPARRRRWCPRAPRTVVSSAIAPAASPMRSARTAAACMISAMRRGSASDASAAPASRSARRSRRPVRSASSASFALRASSVGSATTARPTCSSALATSPSFS